MKILITVSHRNFTFLELKNANHFLLKKKNQMHLIIKTNELNSELFIYYLFIQ